MIFSEEFNISKIYNVSLYAPTQKRVYKYPPRLPTYELMCCIDGEGEFNFDNKRVTLTSGKLLYLPKGTDNDIYTITVTSRLINYNIYFDTACAMPQHAVLISPKTGNFPALYEKVYRIWTGKKQGYYYDAMAEAYKIFKLVYSAQLSYSPSKASARLSAVDDYISEHYCDSNFDCSVLQSMCGLSYSYFKKLFIEKYGMPPVKYITGLRIKRACELLLTNTFTVSEVAEMCGFENVYYFSNVFKRYLGASPKNYSALVPYFD